MLLDFVHGLPVEVVVAIWVFSLELLVVNLLKMALLEFAHKVIVVVACVELVDKCS